MHDKNNQRSAKSFLKEECLSCSRVFTMTTTPPPIDTFCLMFRWTNSPVPYLFIIVSLKRKFFLRIWVSFLFGISTYLSHTHTHTLSFEVPPPLQLDWEKTQAGRQAGRQAGGEVKVEKKVCRLHSLLYINVPIRRTRVSTHSYDTILVRGTNNEFHLYPPKCA